MSPLNRRDFLKTTIAAGAVASVGTLPLQAARRTATDIVTLGNSGMKVTRLAFGTGSNNGHVQAALGQKEFSRLIAYAYDHGIRFFRDRRGLYDAGDAWRGLEAVSARQLPVDEQGDDGFRRRSAEAV